LRRGARGPGLRTTASAASTGISGLSVAIVAYKDLRRNLRVMRQAAALMEAGHQVTVIGFAAPAPSPGAAAVFATGLPAYPKLVTGVLDVGRHVLPGAAMRVVAAALVRAKASRCGRFARAVLQRLSERSFDIVQAHDERALIAAAALGRRCRAGLVFDAVELPFDEEKLPSRPAPRALRLTEIAREIEIARTAAAWLTVSDAIADEVARRHGVRRPLVVRNCPPAGDRPNDGRLRRDLGLAEGVRLLLHLNTLRPGEGVETIIDALALLPDDIHLAALGPEGATGYVARMQRYATARGVAARFHLPPLQPLDRIASYAAGADLGVIARQGHSRNNRMSLPNRLFQMIEARLPIAATPQDEIGRIVRTWELGLLFRESDPAALAATVTQMLEPASFARFRRNTVAAGATLVWERESPAYVKLVEGAAAGR
jgi:glycosyltransferase involved in cell wall biosynthesis